MATENIKIHDKCVRVLYSNSNIEIEESLYPRLPLLINSRNIIIWPATDWLANLILRQGSSQLTIEKKAYVLRQWYEFLEKSGYDWLEARDSLIRLFRRSQMATYLSKYDIKYKETSDEDVYELNSVYKSSRLVAKGRYKSTINFKLNTITQYYLWAQRNGYTENRRIVGVADLSRGINKPPLIIDAKSKYDLSTGDILSETISSPWCYATCVKTRVDVPSFNEIEAVKDALIEVCDNASKYNPWIPAELLLERNSLIIDLLHIGQLRRAEVIRLNVSDIPSERIVIKHLEEGKSYQLEILGKGEKLRKVAIPPYLLENIFQYINDSRKELIYKVKKRNKLIRDKGVLFPSLQTGAEMHPNSINIITNKLRNITGVNIRPHLFRHRGITEYLIERRRQYIDAGTVPDDAQLLVEIKDRLGHSEKTDSVRTYLHLAKVELEYGAAKQNIDQEKVGMLRKIKQLEARVHLEKQRNKYLRKN